MTESDYIIQHLRMDIDKLNKEVRRLEDENKTLKGNIGTCGIMLSNKDTQIELLENALKEEWGSEDIYYCDRCGNPMPEPGWSDGVNEYCDICAYDMGVR